MPDPKITSRFDEIYDSTSKPVLAYITAKCGCTADISDIYQETYTELYQVLNKHGVDYVTSEKALVMRIAKRKIARFYSLQERLRNFISVNNYPDNDDHAELFDKESNAFMTEDFTVRHDQLEAAKKYIQSKPEEVQKVFYLMYDVDLSISEIAQALGITESNVKNKLYRTLKELRSILEENDN